MQRFDDGVFHLKPPRWVREEGATQETETRKGRCSEVKSSSNELVRGIAAGIGATSAKPR